MLRSICRRADRSFILHANEDSRLDGPLRDHAGSDAPRARESFTISNDPPIGEGGSEFARVEQVRIARRPSKCVAAGLEERFKNDKPRRADCRADCRRARSVKEIEDRYE